ncbi:glycosyltransferase WbuB [Sodalis ligni]|uniref:Colanic acid biosynthesis glycosyl transferase WcaI n=1 Tax=Sodalis ligni TaxID=2697027 RepID=A0A4R1NMS1_9GAMM|nr:glycosyltransferase WbuB [Sodalis ligni]TCL07341.1 colanic acid biosynthesis glycosyl transferase WcaI [Sodalis ligni]
MKILIYGINFSPELTGTGKYSGEMAYWLANAGQEVRVITAPPYYPEWSVHENFSSYKFRKEEGAVITYRCPLYVPSSLSLLKRLFHLTSFALSSLLPLIRQKTWKPDCIICIAPTLFCVPGMLLLSKWCNAKSILHIQDYEIDAMLGLEMVKKGFFSRLATAYERWCLTNVNLVSTISKSMMKKAIDKGVPEDNVFFFPNWSEIERFKFIDEESVIQLRRELNIEVGKKVILYAGNIGQKQGLETVIDVAQVMTDSIFLFVGEGGGKEKLERLSREKKLENILFKPLQPYEKLPVLLKLADCHLVIQRRGAADAVLPSKLTNILAVGGNAVITADEQTELGQLCLQEPGIAICVPPESSAQLALGIKQSLGLPKLNLKAQAYANEFLDKESILARYLNILKNI